MKVVEASDLVIKTIKDNKDLHFTVDVIRPLGVVFLKTGLVSMRVKLDSNVTLKKKDKIIVNPDTLEVVKI